MANTSVLQVDRDVKNPSQSYLWYNILIMIAEMSRLSPSMYINCTIPQNKEVNIGELRKILLRRIRESSRYCSGFIYSLGYYLGNFLDLTKHLNEAFIDLI